ARRRGAGVFSTIAPPAGCSSGAPRDHVSGRTPRAIPRVRGPGGAHVALVELLFVAVTVLIGVLRPLFEVLFEAGVAAEFALQRVVVGVRAEILQLPGDLGVLCLLTAAPHA